MELLELAAIAEAVKRTGKPLIAESISTTKGTSMPSPLSKKQFNELLTKAGEIGKGMGGAYEAAVAAADDLADAASRHTPMQNARAQRFVEDVNRAEAKPITEASHMELEVLAAAAWIS
jgi:hypothetical protein